MTGIEASAARAVALYGLAAAAEIAGCLAFWAWIRRRLRRRLARLALGGRGDASGPLGPSRREPVRRGGAHRALWPARGLTSSDPSDRSRRPARPRPGITILPTRPPRRRAPSARPRRRYPSCSLQRLGRQAHSRGGATQNGVSGSFAGGFAGLPASLEHRGHSPIGKPVGHCRHGKARRLLRLRARLYRAFSSEVDLAHVKKANRHETEAIPHKRKRLY